MEGGTLKVTANSSVRSLFAGVALALLPAAARAATVVEPQLRLMAEQRYDDDLRLGAGREGGQLMSKLSPRLGLGLKNPVTTGEGYYAADLLVRHGSGKVTLDHRVGLDLKRTLTRRLRVDGDVRLYRVTDPTSLPRTGLPAPNVAIAYGTARVRGVARLTERTDLHLRYGLEGAKLLQADSQAGFVHAPAAELWYAATRRLFLGAEYRYQAFLYGDSVGQAHGATAALRYRLTRPTTLTLRGGPVSYRGPGGEQGLLPRLQLELARDGQRVDLALVAGHDLVGASGFADAAQWADFASVVATYGWTSKLGLFGAASFFRNGRAPDQGALFGRGGPVSEGYALGGGVDYRLGQRVGLQATYDRLTQVGGAYAGTDLGLARNVLA